MVMTTQKQKIKGQRSAGSQDKEWKQMDGHDYRITIPDNAVVNQ